jgi:hypothetical protein
MGTAPAMPSSPTSPSTAGFRLIESGSSRRAYAEENKEALPEDPRLHLSVVGDGGIGGVPVRLQAGAQDDGYTIRRDHFFLMRRRRHQEKIAAVKAF